MNNAEMQLRYTRDAARDLADITAFIAQENPERARSFVADIKDRCLSLKDFPFRYPAAPDIGESVRRCNMGAYNIYYFTTSGEIVVFAILQRHRHQLNVLEGRRRS